MRERSVHLHTECPIRSASVERTATRPVRQIGRSGRLRTSPFARQQTLQDARVSRRCLEEHRARYLTRAVPKRQRDNDDVIERADDRQELGIKSIGDSTQSSAMTTATRAWRGTRGSRLSRRAVVADAGSTVAMSFAAPGGSRRARTAMSPHVATSTAQAMRTSRTTHADCPLARPASNASRQISARGVTRGVAVCGSPRSLARKSKRAGVGLRGGLASGGDEGARPLFGGSAAAGLSGVRGLPRG